MHPLFSSFAVAEAVCIMLAGAMRNLLFDVIYGMLCESEFMLGLRFQEFSNGTGHQLATWHFGSCCGFIFPV